MMNYVMCSNLLAMTWIYRLEKPISPSADLKKNIKPSTKDRLDVGLVLKGEPETDRLQSGKQFSGMMTHCVAVQSKSDINNELKSWLKQAYESA